MSASGEGAGGPLKKGSAGSKSSKNSDKSGSSTKKSLEEHFGSEVDIKIRSATGNPKVEKYFGSEVDIQSFSPTSSDEAVVSDVLASSGPKPRKVDLEALDRKPFKDALAQDSIKKLEERLDEVVKAQDPESDPTKPTTSDAAKDALLEAQGPKKAVSGRRKPKAEAPNTGGQPGTSTPKGSKSKSKGDEDPEEIGRKVSAMFLAQVDIKEDQASEKDKKKRDDPKKGYLEKVKRDKRDSIIPSSSNPSGGLGTKVPAKGDKIFEKTNKALANAAESKSGSKKPAEGEKDPSKGNKAGDPNAPSSDGPPGKASPAGDGPGGEAAGGPEGTAGGPEGAPGGPDGPGGPGGGPDVPGDGNDPPDPSGGKKEDKKHDANNPPSSAAKRVLILSQKGDWPACEQALKGLERAMAEGGEKLPLANVHDNVTGNTPLMYAAMENKTSLIERMLDLGCDINAKNKERYTTLHLASMYSREDTIKLLLSKRADPALAGGPKNQSCVHLVCSRPTSQALQILRALLTVAPKNARTKPDTDGNIPLFAAIEAGNLHVCRELLSHEAETQIKYAKEPLKDTALHLAGRRKDNDMVKMFIEAGGTVDAKNGDGQTLLHIAAQNGDENMTRTLYLARANATITDNEDRTPMHLAAERGHTGTVEFLADKFKASVFDRTKDGSTLMHIAALNGHPDTAMVLFKKGVPLLMPNRDGARGIHTAAMKGHVSVINTLLHKGENVDAVTNDNYTALHLAVEAGKSNVVETLLGHGAQVHIKGGKVGETPLHIASRIEEVRGEKCTKMLLKSGADTNLAMQDGRTPVHIASESGNIAVLKLLLANGADPLMTDKSGETALHKAARRCHFAAVEEVLTYVEKKQGNCKEYVKMTNRYGEPALHLAAKIQKSQLHFPDEDAKVIDLLMQHGSDVFMQTNETKETVFHYCALEGNVSVLREILKNLHSGQIQLAVNKQSVNGWSPLIVAASKGHTEVAMIFLENNGRVDVFDLEGKSALHLAAENGSIEVCEALLTRNAFINSKTKTGWTSLHYAAMKGYTPLVEFLIKKHNATIDSMTIKKQTPLHLAASAGQESVCALLLELGASLDSTDDYGQKPIHLAAQSNKSEVVKLFLKQRPQLVSVTTRDGSTCAHIAAIKGSVSVLEELMKFDKAVVISSRNKITDSTPLHIATEGGHYDVVKMLMDSGASASDENKSGYTPMHIAAKHGHLELINKFAKSNVNLRQLSRKTGLSALHIASYFGKEDTVRELLTHVPASSKSELPATPNHAIALDLASESDLTPLHLAAYSGSENVVRALLNSSGVQVDAGTKPSQYTALHLASLRGHVGVVGLLLSRSTSLLKVFDKYGQSCLHVAASSGHYEMVQVLLGQGSDYTSVDKDGWTPMHSAAKAGFLNVVKLLVDSGASTLAETANGRIPLWYAASEGNVNVVTYLITQKHDSYSLLDDRKFIFNLMSCGKKSNNAPTENFILASPAPVDVAAKISAYYRDLSIKEKERAYDLVVASKFSEELCNELVTIGSSAESPGLILQSCDRRTVPFLDILIECELKQVIANSAVQTYTTELWKGGIEDWPGWRIFLLMLGFVVFPPLWLIFSLPLNNKYNKTPIVKFGCYLTSHLFFMAFQIITACVPIYPIYRTTLFPYWNEWVCVIWLGGLILGELTSPQDRGGLGMIKIVIIFLNVVAVGIHVAAIFVDTSHWPLLIYIRNLFIGLSFLCCCVQILDFLSFHHLFGPWAIIISSLMIDLGKFLTILMLFEFGFTMLVVAMNQPYFAITEMSQSIDQTTDVLKSSPEADVTPLHAFERLFFALFGLTRPEDLKMTTHIGEWTVEIFKIIFAIYLLVTVIVLINLLIAMMSDTYQRIQQDSDTEWKFGLAKLIRNMHRTDASPAPINLITTWTVYIYRACKRSMKKKDKYKRMKPEATSRMTDVVDNASLKRHLKLGKVSPYPDGLSPSENGNLPLGSLSSMRSRTFLENAIGWAAIVKKYRSLKEAPKGLDELKSESGSPAPPAPIFTDSLTDG